MSDAPVIAVDGAYQNLMTGAGSIADPAANLRIVNSHRLSRDQIDVLVRTEWGCRDYVEELPKEATRKGFELTRVEGSEDEDAPRKVHDLLEELGAYSMVRQAAIWMRQYGGALLIAHVNDGQDVGEPLNLEGKVQLVRLEVRSKESVIAPQQGDLDDDPESPYYGQPRFWRLMPKAGGQSVEIHASRVLLFQGWRPLDEVTAWDWGLSELENFQPAWNKYRHGLNETLAAVPRLAETRLKIPGLRAALGSTDETTRGMFKRYLGEIASVRSALRFLAMDTDEEVEDANIQLQGAVDLLERLREHVAGAAGVSIQRFFRLQQEGLSNNDETGAERDDASTAAFQTEVILPALNWLTTIASAHLKLGLETWQWQAKPLREETPSQKATRQYQEAQTRQIDLVEGVVHPNEVREGLKSRDMPYEWDDAYDETRDDPMDDVEPPVDPDQPPPQDPDNDPEDDPEQRQVA